MVQRDDVPDGGWYVGPTVVVADDPAAGWPPRRSSGRCSGRRRPADFDEALARANDPTTP